MLENTAVTFLSRSLTYKAWVHMRRICYCNTAPGYDATARICSRWDKYENFLKDMGEKPDRYVLCRLDPNFGFDKTNCQWMTRYDAAQHRKYKAILVEGKTEDRSYTLDEYLKRTKCTISKHTVKARMRLGWSVQDAITKPVQSKKNKEAVQTSSPS